MANSLNHLDNGSFEASINWNLEFAAIGLFPQIPVTIPRFLALAHFQQSFKGPLGLDRQNIFQAASVNI